MPDIDLLIELSDYYEVDLREILNGERKSENMDKEVKDTVLQAVDYTNTENEKYNKRIRICNAIGMLLIMAYMILVDSAIYNEYHQVRIITSLIQGMAVGMMFAGLLMSSRYGARIRAFKMRLLKKEK